MELCRLTASSDKLRLWTNLQESNVYLGDYSSGLQKGPEVIRNHISGIKYACMLDFAVSLLLDLSSLNVST